MIQSTHDETAADRWFPWLESPFHDRLRHRKQLSAADMALAEQYRRDGLLLIDLYDRDDPLLQCAIAATTPLYGSYTRIQDAWRRLDAVREIACNPKLLALLGMLYGRAAFPFQTLNFRVGSQQSTHADTMHFSSMPERFMCGVWLALEDITADSGPLHYYPGSHQLPIYSAAALGITGTLVARQAAYGTRYEPFVQALIASHGLEKRTIAPRRGQALIWAANLLHGGEPILRPEATRHSQVTHYYFDDCLWFTPLYSEPERGRLDQRLPTDIRTGRLVEPTVLGRPAGVPPLVRLRSLIREWGRKMPRS